MKPLGSMFWCTMLAMLLVGFGLARVKSLELTLYATIPITMEAGVFAPASAPISSQPIAISALPNSAPPISEPRISALPDLAAPNSALPDSALPISEPPSSALPNSEPRSSALPNSEPRSSALPNSAAPISEAPISALPIAEPPISPAPSSDSSTDPSATLIPNTFVAITGLQIMTSLLPDGTPVLLWGVVRSSDIHTACELIVTRGELNINTSVTDERSGSSVYVMIHVVSVGGECLDVGSSGNNATSSTTAGSELVVEVDSTIAQGRQALVTCPAGSRAQVIGCGVFLIGTDIESLYAIAYGNPRSKLTHAQQRSSLAGRKADPGSNDRHRLDCGAGAQAGFVRGVITGILASENCALLGPRLAPFCIAGVIGVYATMGAYDGCISDANDNSTTVGCFPGASLVYTRTSGPRRMSELRVGDEVAVWRQMLGSASIAYASIYAFGHNDAGATGVFLEMLVSPETGDVNASAMTMLRVSPMHFVPTLVGAAARLSLSAATTFGVASKSKKVLYKRARDLAVGDAVGCGNPLASDMAIVPCIVRGLSWKKMQGLFNPYTTGAGGTIIVDGVVASVHTQWFLDTFFDRLGLTHLLPSAYQLLLSPLRLLYSAIGKDLYAVLYRCIDARIDIPTAAMNHGGTFVASSIFTFATSSTLLFFRRFK